MVTLGAADSRDMRETVKPLSKSAPRPAQSDLPERYRSLGLWRDITTGRWMLVPCTLAWA
jgi:hypothetical protein